jgi:endonuclease/exonuclease/phosphatase family metal-dependent hydrolase
MRVTVGTFNLNNLFSRYNFRGEIDAIQSGDTALDSSVEYKFTDNNTFRIRTFKGKLVKGKEAAERTAIANRIISMDLDVLAVQEVEDIDTLNRFAREDLAGMYRYRVLIEGNDPRLIDLGLLSKLPVGAVTSWRHAVHAGDPGQTVFGRDLLEVEILNATRGRKLFTVFNNHLKSHFVPFGQDPVAGAAAANARRRRQAEKARDIILARTRPNSPFIVLGDMNDPPDTQPMAPLVASAALPLTNALTNPVETRPPKADNPPPATAAWTHRFKPSGQPAEYELYDQIWLSQSLQPKQTGAFIDRRTKHGGDGSDHDPAWIELDL